MISRPAPLALAAALLVAALAGCSPTPEPAPEPTSGFASEEEAFAAAEETYRSYVEALNQVDLSDPETFEDVYAWTTGEANAGERRALSQMHADGWEVDGETLTVDFVGKSFNAKVPTAVVATVCSNVEAVRVTDAQGASMVPADRPDTYELEVSFLGAPESPTGLLIEASNAVEETNCAQ